jgi:hypothetical protein
MGFVHNLDQMACRPPPQEPFNTIGQNFIAVYRHSCCLCPLKLTVSIDIDSAWDMGLWIFFAHYCGYFSPNAA